MTVGAPFIGISVLVCREDQSNLREAVRFMADQLISKIIQGLDRSVVTAAAVRPYVSTEGSDTAEVNNAEHS